MKQLLLDLGMGNRFYDERLHKAHVRARKRWLKDFFLDKRLHDAHIRAYARRRFAQLCARLGFFTAHVMAWKRSRPEYRRKAYARFITRQVIRRAAQAARRAIPRAEP